MRPAWKKPFPMSGPPAPASAPSSAAATPSPAFIIGVTGNYDPVGYLHSIPKNTQSPEDTPPAPSILAIEQTVFNIIDWLQHTPVKGQPTGRLDPDTHQWLPGENTARDTRETYQSCWQPLALGDTPIVFLSSLAPGIDTLVAEAVFKYQDLHPGTPVTVRAPLPFPEDVYRDSSSFKADDPALNAPGVDNDLRKRYADTLARLKQQPGFDPARDIFCVPLHESIAGDPVADLTQIDPTAHRPRRYLRYRAAGEYIAAYSDILLAFYDEAHAAAENLDPFDPFTAGTAAIVEAKRRGLTDRLLPIPKTISWADTGPVLHIPIDRKKNTTVAVPAANRPLRLLQPYDALPDGLHQMVSPPDLLPKWQENGDRILRETARSFSSYLEGLKTAVPKFGTPQKALLALFAENRENLPQHAPGHPVAQAVQTAAHCPVHPFGHLAVLREKTATVARKRDGEVKKELTRTFQLTIASVVFFVASGMSWDHLLPPSSSWLVPWFTGGAFLLASILFVYVIFRNGRFSRKRIEDKHFDSRSVAEGMRIQLYWSISGLFSSVASRYIQRLRGELGWIRYVTSSVTFPYQRAEAWFRGLLPREQYNLLCGVRDGWLRGQLFYFRKSTNEAALQRDSWRILGKSLILAALLVAAYAVYLSVFEDAIYSYCQPRSGKFILILSGALFLLFSFWAAEELLRRRRLSSSPQPEAASRKKISWHFWRCFFPSFWHDSWQTSQERAQQIIHNLQRWVLIPFFGFSIAVILCLGWGLLPIWDPCQADHVTAITGGLKSLLLALGGFTLLWVEKSFFEENHLRYSAMLQLYAGAEKRMSHKLEELHPLVSANPASPTATLLIKDMQDLLFHVGQEALSENAEWIVMRRTRRIEPITPDL